MAVVRILTVHLAGPSCQQVLQGPKTVLDPGAPLPRSDEPRRTDIGVQTQQVILICPCLIDNRDAHGAIGRTGGPQPYITYPRDLGAVTPGPIAGLLQVTP